jgi:GAF domain-containing protein
MKPASIPANEPERLQSLNEHELLDTLPEEVYDDITRLASEITGTPISLITLIDEDRQWFKSRQNYTVEESSRQISFCAHAILQSNEVMVVPDARYDERFHDNPLTLENPGVIFYAGVPLTDEKENALGTLCVIDHRPRELSEQQIESLKALAKLVKTHFELRKVKMDLDKAQEDLRMVQSLVNTMQDEIKDVVKHDPGSQDVQQITEALQVAVDALKRTPGTNQEEN